jgi:hypothetical protein
MKKFLSLVLAVIMTMSLVTISASAAEYKDFTDKDEIQYEEAVAVLNRLGIITGYSEGDFRPEGELTRGAAAKIIVSLLIGPEAANNVSPTTAPYKDVPLDHTFAGVIAYCKTAGIISGYSDGSFQPGGTLTGYAFSKMLLGALGYKSDVEHFTGSGWNMNVNARAAEAGLFDRLSFKGNDPVNREEAAQLALNTLKATLVEYTGGMTVTTGDATVVGAQTRTYKISNQEYATHIRNRKASQVGNATGDTHYTVEFGEEHFVDLRMTHDRNALDDFGRPSNEWSYKKVTIGTFPIEADKTYTEQVAHNVTTVTNASKARALELTGFKVNSNTTVTINGKTMDASNLKDVGQIADYTDNGTRVEVYIDEDVADWVRNIVVVKTQLMEVKRLGKESVSLDLYDGGSANKGKNVYGFNEKALDVKVDNVEIDDAYYTLLSGLKVGDLVAVVPVTTDGGSSYTVAKAYVPETVSGSLKKVTTYGNSATNVNTIGVTVGDTAYDVALWNKDLVDIDGQKLDVTTKDVTLVLDEYGNALLAKDVGATSDFMVVGSYYQNLVNGKLMTYAKGWDISGEELDLNLGSKHKGYGSAIQPGDLVFYTNATSGDADWTLSDSSEKGVFDVYTGKDSAANNAPYSIKASNSRIRTEQTFGTDDNPWIDKGIKFIYVTFNDDGDVDSINIKNGVQAASNSELARCYNKVHNDSCAYNAAQLALKLKDNKVTTDSTVKAVVIKNESNDAVASNMLYVVNYIGGAGKTENGDIVYEYTVAMNGANGLIDDEMTIYSTKKLIRGDWARYTEVKNDDYDNFYKLSAVDQRGRATSTMVATLQSYPVTNNKSLVKVDSTKMFGIDGTALTAAKNNEPKISIAKDNNLGIGDDKAAYLISLRYAVWVDLTGNGIDSYDDLADLMDEPGYNLSRVRVSMIFNDDSSKDNFRQVAMIVVQSVTDNSSSNGGNAGNESSGAGLGAAEVGNTNINRKATVNKAGQVIVTVDVTKPSWAGADSALNYAIAATVDGVSATITNPGTGVNRGLNDSFLLTNVPTADEDSDVRVTVSNLTWTQVKASVEVTGATNGAVTAVAGANNVLNTSGTNSIVITAPEGKYTAAKVTVKQAGVDDQTPDTVTSKTTANGVDTFTVSGITAASTGLVTVTVEMTAGTKTITPVVTNTIASSPAVEKTGTTGADYYVDSVKALDAGVYAFPTGIVQTQLADGNPLYRGGTDVADEDCLIFVFEKSGLVETYTFTIDNVSTYVESMTGAAGNVTNSFFHVQVNDNKSGDFSNSGNGSMRTMALAAGSHSYSIVGSKSGTVASGTFTIKKDGDEFTNPNLAVAPIGNKTDTNTYDDLFKALPDGAYVMPDGAKNDASFGADVHGEATQNRIFKFETTTAQDKVTLTIYAADGTVMYTEKEAGPFAVGPHFFYVQVTGESLDNAGTGPMETTGLEEGTYTWTVYSKNDGMLMQGVMDIAAES